MAQPETTAPLDAPRAGDGALPYERPGPVETQHGDVISPIEEVIEDARKGRMFLLVDHEDRENEGDLVIPAQMATPEAVNFMATHGRGLICLALTSERVDQLGLPLMSTQNASRHETAFTVSIEAREGVSTGISAHDRARTIQVAIDPGKGPADLATPGHVFPLRARDGGVLVRAGHTEAACDISRLAGLRPAGVICEVMRDDGEMARLPDLIAFAQRHGIKIGTISDLIRYRRRHDNLVRQTTEREVDSRHGGSWTMRIFSDVTQGAEHIVLTKGCVPGEGPALVRMHALNAFEDVLGVGTSDLAGAMEAIAAEGRGVVVLLRDTNMKMDSGLEGPEGVSPQRLRAYGLGAEILAALGLREIELLTNSARPRVVGLEAYGLTICGTRAIPGEAG
jgi:3,4-dihydroxy 2-butanone 4-phosphate synthase/GTP cyclohydrolase II